MKYQTPQPLEPTWHCSSPSMALWVVEDWVSAEGFESGFRYGQEHIALTNVSNVENVGIVAINFVVLDPTEIDQLVIRSGGGDDYVYYNPPKTAQWPVEELSVNSVNGSALYNVEFCGEIQPTDIGVIGFQEGKDDPPFTGMIALLFAVMLLSVAIILIRRQK